MRLITVAVVLSLAGCYTHHLSGDGSAADADAVVEPDAADPCSCSPDSPVTDHPVKMFHPCTPPLEIGCEDTPCEPGVTDCGEGFTCETCSLSACCVCEQCFPSCVFTGPAMGPLPEYLKLQRTSGPANEEQIVVVEGYPFYVGALFYLGRVGDSGDLMQDYSEEVCRVGFRALARGPGTVPVWVSQDGGNDPHQPREE